VSDEGCKELKGPGEVTLHDLAVIQVQQQPDTVAADEADDVRSVLLALDERAWPVVGVDRLDHERDVGAAALCGGPGEILQVRVGGLALDDGGWLDAGHDVDQRAADRDGVLQRSVESGAEFRTCAGNAGCAELGVAPARPGRGVEQNLRDACIAEDLPPAGGRQVVWLGVFDRTEPGLSGRGRPFLDATFAEQPFQIFMRHFVALPWGR
jgi:hypothetical protein